MKKNSNIFGITLIITLFVLLTITGIISYKSIDWNILKKIESQPLVLPTPIPSLSTSSATIQK